MGDLTQRARAFLVQKQTISPVRSRAQWITAWRELATLTEGISEHDPRVQPILRVLDACDRAFEKDNWTEFSKAYQSIKALVDTEGKGKTSK